LQNPVVLRRSGFWYTFSICVQLSSLLFTIHYTHTICFGLIGHIQVYKLVFYCRILWATKRELKFNISVINGRICDYREEWLTVMNKRRMVNCYEQTDSQNLHFLKNKRVYIQYMEHKHVFYWNTKSQDIWDMSMAFI
jgi:hypothetical protein